MTNQTFAQDQFRHNVKKHQNWSRLLYMLIFGLLLNLAGAVMWLLAALQFIFVLGTGEDNRQLRHFGKALADFIRDALLFVSYNTERKPFPFADWPHPEATPDNNTQSYGQEQNPAAPNNDPNDPNATH